MRQIIFSTLGNSLEQKDKFLTLFQFGLPVRQHARDQCRNIECLQHKHDAANMFSRRVGNRLRGSEGGAAL